MIQVCFVYFFFVSSFLSLFEDARSGVSVLWSNPDKRYVYVCVFKISTNFPLNYLRHRVRHLFEHKFFRFLEYFCVLEKEVKLNER